MTAGRVRVDHKTRHRPGHSRPGRDEGRDLDGLSNSAVGSDPSCETRPL